ncbi:MAG: TetR family transcriptional regulator [Deltaproteobacteria bacterium]|nr:TetR family transcriptional regulator [Deltaproteobacteria bacterium]
MRPSNTTERRQEIAEALRRVMATEGYERATIQRIAHEAGLAPGLVHYHFDSKAEILALLVETLVGRFESRIARRTKGSESALDQLDRLLEGLLARGDDEDLESVRCWTLVGAQAVKDADVRVLYERHLATLTDRIAALVVTACHDEGKSGEGARAMAGALVALTEGYFALAAASPRLVATGSASAMAKRTLRGLLAGQPRKETS